MSQAPEFVDPAHPHHVFIHSKCLYGFKQSPRVWSHFLSLVLEAQGFHASSSDSSFFVQHSHGGTTIFLVYMDDILVTGRKSHYNQDLARAITSHFALKDLRPLHYFLSIHVISTSKHLHLSQTQYLKDILSHAHMLEAKPCSSPMVGNTHLSHHDGNPLNNLTCPL